MAKLHLHKQFKEALRLMEKSDKNLFITGKAGTGKSTLLDYFRRNTEKNPVILAPTGVAALNVEGLTIHRFFEFYIDVTPERIAARKVRPSDPAIYRNLQMIIIDEVSMLRADMLDCVDAFLRLYGPKKRTSFGGVQMVFVGDLYQLPPVVGREEREMFRSHYRTPYFFSAQALEEVELEMVELEHVYRQKDDKFVRLLNKIRNKSVEPEDLEELNERYDEAPPQTQEFTITLTTTNKCADAINEEHLKALRGRMYHSTADISGDFGKEYYPTATRLQYKVGSQIMLLNNDGQDRWVNGSIGVIKAIKRGADDERYLRVQLRDDDEVVSVSAFRWEVYKFTVEGGALKAEPVGSFTQLPFRLAWAVTIHKSQGKTFERVIIDIGRGTFASGQMYVALSRCTSLEGITLKVPIKEHHIRTDARIYKFLTSHAYNKASQLLSGEDRRDMIKEAIAAGTSLEMTYLKANDTKSKRIIKPLRLAEEEYLGHSYEGMLAYCTHRKAERMFNVDRILTLKKV